MSDIENFDQAVSWTEKDEGPFQKHNRDVFAFKLAIKCCKAGIDKYFAYSEMLSRYKEGGNDPFTERQILKCLTSGYKSNGHAITPKQTTMTRKIEDIDTRPLNEAELAYWNKYGITPEILNKYQVLAVNGYIIGKHKETSTPDNPIFCYHAGKSTYKIYRPEANENQNKFMWIGKKPEKWLFGLDFCQGSQEVFITGGEKDVLTLIGQGKEAFTLNSETATMPAELAEKLKKQYKKIIILYDNDKTGIDHSIEICNEFGFTRGILPVDLKKDISNLIEFGRSMDEIKYESPKTTPAAAKKKYDFFKIILDRESRFNGLKINYIKFNEILYSFGFRRYDIERGNIYIKIKNQIIEEVFKNNIQDQFMDFLKSLPEKINKDVTRESIIEKFISSPAQYFCENRYNFLVPEENIIFNNDTGKEAFIYYKNGFVKCTPQGYELIKYSQLKGFIWKNQILDRDFKKTETSHGIDDFGTYGKFINNIAGQNDARWQSICSIIGYNLHSSTEGKLKATVLTDSKISEKPDGRTGKTLFAKAFMNIKNCCIINGKDWDPRRGFKYQEAKIDTQIICLNDVKNNKRSKFDFEDLFNDITEGVKVEYKNQPPFTIHPKIIITTNKTLDIEGASARDRAIEFEFSEHYSDKLSPEDEFGYWLFGKEFPKEEWIKFDNFMMWCICFYLDKGIIEPPQINLNKRKLLDRTGQEFVEFMNYKIENKQIDTNLEYSKDDLHTEFLEQNSDLKNTYWQFQRNFTNALKYWALYTPGIKNEVKERKSGKGRFITFYDD